MSTNKTYTVEIKTGKSVSESTTHTSVQNALAHVSSSKLLKGGHPTRTTVSYGDLTYVKSLYPNGSKKAGQVALKRGKETLCWKTFTTDAEADAWRENALKRNGCKAEASAYKIAYDNGYTVVMFQTSVSGGTERKAASKPNAPKPTSTRKSAAKAPSKKAAPKADTAITLTIGGQTFAVTLTPIA